MSDTSITGIPWSPAKCGCVALRLAPSPSTLAFATKVEQWSLVVWETFDQARRLLHRPPRRQPSPQAPPPATWLIRHRSGCPCWLMVSGKASHHPARRRQWRQMRCALCSFLVSCTYFALGDCLDLCLSVHPPASGSLFVLFFRRLPRLPVLVCPFLFAVVFAGLRGCRCLFGVSLFATPLVLF